jgi:hypothetical protein
MVRDVLLGDGGLLAGYIVDRQGHPAAHAIVTVESATGVVKEVTAGADGKFAVTGLATGIHKVTSRGQSAVLRTWTQALAPPSASNGVLVVSEETATTRGQTSDEDQRRRRRCLLILGGFGGAVTTVIVSATGSSS